MEAATCWSSTCGKRVEPSGAACSFCGAPLLIRDKYRIVRLLGQGGTGIVYEAVDKTLGRRCALKTLHGRHAATSPARRRFETECRAMAALDHPGIARIYDADAHHDQLFFVQQLVPGKTLRASLGAWTQPASGPSLDAILEIGLGLLDAIEHAHAKGVVHRDINPNNVLLVELTGALRPVLIDFGMARLVEQESTRAAWGGTPGYAAPEQILEPESNDRRSDVFAVAMVLYAMLSRGSTAYGAALSANAITSPTMLVRAYKAIVDGAARPVPLRSLNQAISTKLEGIVMKAVAPHPAARFQTAAEMAEALRRSCTVIGSSGEGLSEQRAPTVPLEVRAVARSSRTAPVAAPRATFFGREHELRRLRGFLGQAFERRGQLCFITGEAGTGKSALASELVRVAELEHDGVLVASGECCVRTGPIDPYLPFREVLSSLVGGTSEMTGAKELAGRTLVETAPELIGKLVSRSHVAPAALAGRALPSVTSDLSRDRTFESIAELFRALARRAPLVITLDNIQCIDAVSADLLGHLARTLRDAPVFFMGLYRPSALQTSGGGRQRLDPLLSEIKQRDGDVWIDLDSIAGSEARAFVDALLDQEPNTFPESFRAKLLEHTQGHALFTLELLRAMKDAGLLAPDAEGRLGAPEDVKWPSLPARLEGVVEERLRGLDDDLRETLTVACVGGLKFLAQSLALVRDRSPRDVLRQLMQELDRKQRLVQEVGARRTAQGLISEFRFRNSLAQQYLYDQLGDSERMMLHGDFGAALESLFGDNAGDNAVVLARHFELAGEAEKALIHLRGAAERAARMGAYADARSSLERALLLLENHPELRARMEVELSAALAALNERAPTSSASLVAPSP